ncbi:MAG: RNA methyltransferase [Pseudomonadota bacterium]|jgi:TrmH family RNA methyltransferase
MKIITSRDNALYKTFRKLAGSARERRKSGRTLLDGAHLIGAYREMIGLPETVVVAASAREQPEIPALVKGLPPAAQIVLDDALFRELSPVETPTGVLALISVPRLAPPVPPGFSVFLEAIRDPGNLGSILRSAAAAGVEAAYLSAGCADAWSPRVLRGGMGAHFVLPIVEGVDLARQAREFPGNVVVTSLQAEKSLYQLDLSGPVAFVVGNEGAGVSPELRRAAGAVVTIPMPGAVESLNAAAAAAVCLFERVRQVKWPG